MMSPTMGYLGGKIRAPLALCSSLFLALCIFYLYNFQIPTLISNPLDWNNNNNFAERTMMQVQIQIPDCDERKRIFEIRFKNIHVEYRYNFTDPCANSTKFLLMSMTRRDSFEKRKGVRQTWMADAHNKEKIRFLIADSNEKLEDDDILKRLEEEQAKYGDLVFIHGFTDNYQHIHLKWYAGLKWQQTYCPDVEWVAKADDDTVVDLRRLDFWIDHKFRQIVAEHPLLFLGFMNDHDKPKRNPKSKWYVPESLFPADKFPAYVLGAVYLTNPATIAAILAQSLNSIGFFLDDVLFTGILAEMANVTRVNMSKHFIWSSRIDVKDPDCEYGVPTAVSFWGAKQIKQFEKNYKQLKSLQCTNDDEIL